MNDLYKELFERAVKAAENSSSPYSRFKWEQRFCAVTVQFIRVVILKILPFRLQTVLNEQPSSRQYQKERKNLRLLLLPEVMTI